MQTEREVAAWAKEAAEASGFRKFDEFGKPLSAGEKVYVANRGKAIILCVKGKKPINEGVRIAAAHIDSPRVDLKQCPVYEDGSMAFFKTHYYGGIKNISGPPFRFRFTAEFARMTALALISASAKSPASRNSASRIFCPILRWSNTQESPMSLLRARK